MLNLRGSFSSPALRKESCIGVVPSLTSPSTTKAPLGKESNTTVNDSGMTAGAGAVWTGTGAGAGRGRSATKARTTSATTPSALPAISGTRDGSGILSVPCDGVGTDGSGGGTWAKGLVALELVPGGALSLLIESRPHRTVSLSP